MLTLEDIQKFIHACKEVFYTKEEIDNKFNTLFGYTDEKFKRTDERFEKQKASLQSLQTSVDSLATNMQTFQTELSSQRIRLDRIEEKVGIKSKTEPA